MAVNRQIFINDKASELGWIPIQCKQKNMISFRCLFNKTQYRVNCWLKKANKTSIRIQAKNVNVSWLNVELSDLDATLMMVKDEIMQPEGR